MLGGRPSSTTHLQSTGGGSGAGCGLTAWRPLCAAICSLCELGPWHHGQGECAPGTSTVLASAQEHVLVPTPLRAASAHLTQVLGKPMGAQSKGFEVTPGGLWAMPDWRNGVFTLCLLFNLWRGKEGTQSLTAEPACESSPSASHIYGALSIPCLLGTKDSAVTQRHSLLSQ